ncbi:hypothetical protein AYI70_g7746 [Smittium culicis]|uniref:YABBY protein C-terminal domain-containing protein n=1 Tax=Smittium culicis TaxID=133412 RepID=A0A1R1XJ95_9FUNG|nr:hypothetical protein AYI70_g8980 [Smittium culicis]OMJ14668.1 hypothetical protein AYI70_g7746 [Smittium culicis]
MPKQASKKSGGRKLSAYNVYMKEALPKYKSDHPGVSHKDAFCQVANNWKNSTAEEKAALVSVAGNTDTSLSGSTMSKGEAMDSMICDGNVNAICAEENSIISGRVTSKVAAKFGGSMETSNCGVASSGLKMTGHVVSDTMTSMHDAGNIGSSIMSSGGANGRALGCSDNKTTGKNIEINAELARSVVVEPTASTAKSSAINSSTLNTHSDVSVGNSVMCTETSNHRTGNEEIANTTAAGPGGLSGQRIGDQINHSVSNEDTVNTTSSKQSGFMDIIDSIPTHNTQSEDYVSKQELHSQRIFGLW